ncbi:ABC transporter permease [Aquiflexum gelatinilyticum]|uniref:ABC transporter permease n=1 Tax=Aquiflexum gelatinilyticum TaxID=2961943 RepID=A0A9X2P3P5_9BACT|nr:ABC transporter permease [Aquiflexum gelatinilyticum]MCR9015326.1 ABC transporter permease [Aquiflexum gelatinilyticum]
MFKNIFKTAIRSFWKTKTISLINVLGLSLGIAICIIISLFLFNELSYDKHHTNAERIYRVKSDIIFGGNSFNMIQCPAPMAEAMPLEIPEVEAAVHFRSQGSFLVKREEDNIKENDVVYAGKDFFKVFTVPLVEGNVEGALDEPNTMAISKKTADKFFPNESAVGKTLILDNKSNYKITAVYEDMPVNSHFHFDLILAAAGLEEAQSTFWLSNNFPTYLLLHEGADPAAVDAKLKEMIQTHVVPALGQVMGESFSLTEFESSGNKIDYSLQPLLDIHLYSNLQGEFEPNFNITYIYMFAAIAVFILLIACINFMNLSTARSSSRAKEVGVRKALGSGKKDLMWQFLTETFLMSLFSFIVALAITVFLLPFFNELSNRSLEIPYSDILFYVSLLGGAFFVGLLAGIYPSFFLAAFEPIKVLKGNLSGRKGSGSVRSSLVVFQFAISIILIIATVSVFSQLNYIQKKELGFNKDQVIMVEDIYALGDQAQSFKDEIVQSSLVDVGTFSGFLPVSGTWRSDNPWWGEGKDPKQQENLVSLQNWSVDFDYIKTLGMKIIEGRDFSVEFPSDSNAVILNQTALKNFNLEGNPIGQRIATFSGNPTDGLSNMDLEYKTIVGIVENFHFESLKENINAVMIYPSKRPQGFASFKFNAKDSKEVIDLVESKWRSIAPGQPFNYSFLDDKFGDMYKAESRIGNVFASFTVIAIFIACLGLFALTAYTAEQRRKEIGIRKALGASVGGIVFLLSQEFTKLVLIAFVFAAPLAWYGMSQWLEDYQFRIDLGWEIFVFSALGVLLVAWGVMGVQSVRAAMANPVDSLRSE